jgi:hypothetical protein
MLIELTRGKRAIVDVIDKDLAGKSWHAVPGHHPIGNYTFYAARRKGNKHITLHRVILERILGRHLHHVGSLPKMLISPFKDSSKIQLP